MVSSKTRFIPSVLRALALSGIAAAVLLTGCAAHEIRSQVSTGEAQANSGVAAALAKRTEELSTAAKRPLRSQLPYVNVTPIPYAPSLPATFNAQATAAIPRLPAWKFAAMLSRLTGLDVQMSDDLLYNVATTVTGGATAPADATLHASAPSVSSSAQAAVIGPLNYSGSVKGMLDNLADMLDARWSYDRNTNAIRIYRFETRVFHIASIPGDMTVGADVSDTGSSNNVSGMQGQTIRTGTANTTTVYKGAVTPWTSIADTIKQMLSPAGTMVVSQPLSQISVRDHWRNVDAVARYVADTNDDMTQEVAVNVKIYQVQVDHSNMTDFSLEALYNSLGQMASSPGFSFSTPSSQITSAGSIVVSPPKADATGHLTPWSGSQFVIQALSTLGNVSTVMDSSVETVNNVPAPFHHYLLTGYLASTTPSLYTGSGSSAVTGASAGLTPGSVETGISLQVLPSVQPDGRRVLLQVALSMSVLNGLQTVTSAGQQIQVPQISGDKMLPRQTVRSGDSLVIPALITSTDSDTTNTPFGRSTWALGGNRALSHGKTALVVVITPVAVSKNSTL